MTRPLLQGTVSLLGLQLLCPTRLLPPKGCVAGLCLGLAKNISFFSDQIVFMGESRKEGVVLGVIAVL